MIENREYIIDRSMLPEITGLPEILSEKSQGKILRWYISRVTAQAIHVEATLWSGSLPALPPVSSRPVFPGRSVVVSVIPTGIGCEVGGYAADAAPATSLMAACTDYLITNPNAVNASDFISLKDNVLYTEGLIIDRFCQGTLDLYITPRNRVGLIIEKTGPENLAVVFNIVNAVRAIHGVDIVDWVVTDEPIGGRCLQEKSGAYVGEIENPGTLFSACDYLLKRGANALAITSNIRELPLDNYALHFAGKHPNPVGGAEAVISHLVGRRYGLPAAHAPMINTRQMNLVDPVVDARGAGEYSSASGLACVLVGLGRSPQFSLENRYGIVDAVNIRNLIAVVAPAAALGGIPMLYAERFGIPIVAVKENGTILQVRSGDLGLKNVIEVGNYAEAAGVIQALRQGIAIESLYRPFVTMRPGLGKSAAADRG